jgi:uncharacterized protein
MPVFIRDNTIFITDQMSKYGQFLHVLIGARQTGKSTAAKQIADKLNLPTLSISADNPEQLAPSWIEEHWNRAISLSQPNRPALLIIDEMQKIHNWSETVKLLWDKIKDKSEPPIKVLLLGSSSLLTQEGLTESLAGRFLLHRSPHWSWMEMRDAFGWSLEEWIYFGGYPGAAALIRSEEQWRTYVLDSLIETTLARDILQMQKVAKPALLRALFFMASRHPAQIISYTKLMGMLQDAGNAGTVAHYLKLLGDAFLIKGLPKFPSHTSRASSPKIIVQNNALVSACDNKSFQSVLNNKATWGRHIENAVGLHLINSLHSSQFEISYFRERYQGKDLEVDFVLKDSSNIYGIEVTGSEVHSRAGIESFKRRYPKAKIIEIGPAGISFEEFFGKNPLQFI